LSSETDRKLHALWFAQPPLLGHLHLPIGPPTDTAVVICATPFGYENVCGHRSLRRLADRLAADGVPTLRFDVSGTGDSDGEQQLPAWLDSVRAAVATVRAETERERVVVIGIGLGGTLAVAAADAGLEVDGLVLWASPDRGSPWLREQRARHRVAVVNRDPDQPPPPEPPPGVEDLYGFAMTSTLANDLSALDLGAPAADAWPEERRRPAILAIARGAKPDTTKLADALRRRGLTVEEEVWDGWDRMHDEPHLAVVPEEAFAGIIRWVLDGGGSGAALPAGAAADPAAGARTLVADGQVEEIASYTPGEDGGLFSVACLPAGPPVRDIWLVFLTGRAVRHIGPNRMWVRFARELAREGFASLRLDGRSVGDSDGEGHGLMPNEEYYQPFIWDDIENVMNVVGLGSGAERFMLLGICSGATASYEIAWRRDDVPAILMLNPLQLKIDYEDYEKELLAHTVKGVTNLQAWRRAKNYRRLLKGQIPVGKALRASLRRGRSPVAVGDNYVVEGFHGLADKPVEIDIFLSEGDGSVRFLERFAGRGLPGFENEHLRVRRIPHSDHTLRQLYAQDQFRETLRNALGRVAEPE
jgi:dienelactone hydrolase